MDGMTILVPARISGVSKKIAFAKLTVAVVPSISKP